jgi:hypothetical protein
MRTGISFSVTPFDVHRLRGLVKDRNAPQKHVWRARIVLLSVERLGTNAIMRETGKSKNCVWRWQERFAAEGVDGLLRDNRARNLKAYCQRCHMLHDREDHRRRRRIAFRKKNALGDLFLGRYSNLT